MRRTMLLLVAAAAVVVAVVAGAVETLLASGPSGDATKTRASDATVPASSGQARWVIRDLGLLGGVASYASAVNERGQVVGGSMPPWAKSGSYPFFWQNRKMRSVGTLGGQKSAVVAINDNGQVIGNSDTKSGASHAFLWQDGRMTDLGTLGGKRSEAAAINRQGQIVGGCDTGEFTHGGGLPVYQAFLWQNGKMRVIGRFIARAINERGQVIGDDDEGVAARSFLWEEDNITDLGSLGDPNQGGAYTYTYAFAINERGQVIGEEEVIDGGAGGFSGVRSFLWQNGKIRDLGTLNPAAINDRGQVVGSSTTNTRESRAASLWENGKMTDLGTLPGGKESSATAINNRGQIVGWATTKNGQKHAVLWTLRSG